MRKTSGHKLPLQAVRNTDSEEGSSEGVDSTDLKKSPCLEVIKLKEWLINTGTVIAKL